MQSFRSENMHPTVCLASVAARENPVSLTCAVVRLREPRGHRRHANWLRPSTLHRRTPSLPSLGAKPPALLPALRSKLRLRSPPHPLGGSSPAIQRHRKGSRRYGEPAKQVKDEAGGQMPMVTAANRGTIADPGNGELHANPDNDTLAANQGATPGYSAPLLMATASWNRATRASAAVGTRCHSASPAAARPTSPSIGAGPPMPSMLEAGSPAHAAACSPTTGWIRTSRPDLVGEGRLHRLAPRRAVNTAATTIRAPKSWRRRRKSLRRTSQPPHHCHLPCGRPDFRRPAQATTRSMEGGGGSG
uniref:Uncharacterized protein n=1 Tax=Arundo donax TaxID=35708 RepID=A0A0A9DBD2_ARUDO